MTVTAPRGTSAGASETAGRGGSGRREPGPGERDAFAGMVKRGKRGNREGGACDEPGVELPPGGWSGAALMPVSTGIRRGALALAGEVGRASGPSQATPGADLDSLPPGAQQVATGDKAAELTLRFPGGPWAGLEIQAALHAGSIVLTLRPQNKQQEKRLSQARDALVDEVKAQTGADIRVELKEAKDATR